MSVNPAAHDAAQAELGRLVLCKRPIEVQRLAEKSALVDLARQRSPESSSSPARLLDRLLAEAIMSIGIDDVEQAADALLTDQYGPRWVALADRQERAATAISGLTGSSLTRDGFRRKRKTDGRSRQDDVLEQVALAILGLCGPPTVADGDDDADGDAPSEQPVDAAPTARRTVTAIAILVGVALIGAGVLFATRRRPTGATQPTTPIEEAYNCSIAPAEAAPGIDAAPDQIEFLSRTLADHLDETGLACPDELADYWADTDLIVQRLHSSSTRWSGVLVATPQQMGFTLTAGQWFGLLHAHELAAAEQHPAFVPLNEEHRAGQSWVQADAGWLVGERWGQPHFLVSGPWQRVWERNGRLDGQLGRPTSNVYDDGQEVRRQDFEGGSLSAID